MKEHPMLFKPEMVRKILTDEKTNTRRLVAWPKHAFLYGREPLPDKSFADRGGFSDGPYLHAAYGGGDLGDDCLSTRVYAPWEVGDRIWVKETWRPIPDGPNVRVRYAADGHARVFAESHIPDSWELPMAAASGNVTPLYLPRWASRLVLEVTSVRVQRLQDISEEDALAEGVEAGPMVTPRGAFAVLWDSINHKRATWTSNPFVWAIGFHQEANRSKQERENGSRHPKT